MKRRQLNTFQKIELNLSTKPILQEIAKQRMLSGKSNPSQISDMGKGRVDDIIAEKAVSSRDSVRKVEFLLKNASEQKLEQLRQGKTKISKAYQQVCKDISRQKLAQSSAAESATHTTDSNLMLGDMQELGKNILDESIDLIFTDPPYNEASLYLYGDLAKLAQRVLKQNGSLVTFAGHYAIFKINKLIEQNSSLQFHWFLCVKHNGHISRMWKHRVWPKYKPLLWYYKGTKPTMFEDVTDLIESQPVSKTNHDWEQSTVEAQHMIKPLTLEGMTVFDPFMGSGTTGIAALKLKRKFIGIEIDPVSYSVAQTRLSTMTNEVRA